MDDKGTEQNQTATNRRHRIPVSLKDPETLRALIDTLAEGTYVSTLDGRIIDANPAFLDMLGAQRLEDITDHDLWPDAERRRDFEQEVVQRGAVNEFELDVRCLDGAIVTVLDTCHVHKEDGEVIALYGVLLDITKRKTLEAQLAQLSVRDPLTGCYNRRYLQAQRPVMERPSYFYGCLMMDLDGFKEINDSYGHEEGDRVLQRFAHFLIRNKRADDVLVRLGGDEFALFVEVVAPENLDIITERLMANAPAQAPTAFSIGQAYRVPGETLDEIIARADAAMYAAKGREVEGVDRRSQDSGDH